MRLDLGAGGCQLCSCPRWGPKASLPKPLLMYMSHTRRTIPCNPQGTLRQPTSCSVAGPARTPPALPPAVPVPVSLVPPIRAPAPRAQPRPCRRAAPAPPTTGSVPRWRTLATAGESESEGESVCFWLVSSRSPGAHAHVWARFGTCIAAAFLRSASWHDMARLKRSTSPGMPSG